MTNIEKLPNEDIYNDALARKGVRFLSQSRRLRKRLDELNQERPKEQGSRVGCPHAGMICFANGSSFDDSCRRSNRWRLIRQLMSSKQPMAA